MMKISIEGGELLEHLIETGLAKLIRNIEVQFHNVVPDAKEKIVSIQRELKKTHILLTSTRLCLKTENVKCGKYFARRTLL
jgi:hypothetical protein